MVELRYGGFDAAVDSLDLIQLVGRVFEAGLHFLLAHVVVGELGDPVAHGTGDLLLVFLLHVVGAGGVELMAGTQLAVLLLVELLNEGEDLHSVCDVLLRLVDEVVDVFVLDVALGEGEFVGDERVV